MPISARTAGSLNAPCKLGPDNPVPRMPSRGPSSRTGAFRRCCCHETPAKWWYEERRLVRREQQKDFEELEASQLFCPTCRRAMPVRKRLFLVLLDKEMFDSSALGVAPWWGKRSSRGGVPLNGRESEGRRAQFLPHSTP